MGNDLGTVSRGAAICNLPTVAADDGADAAAENMQSYNPYAKYDSNALAPVGYKTNLKTLLNQSTSQQDTLKAASTSAKALDLPDSAKPLNPVVPSDPFDNSVSFKSTSVDTTTDPRKTTTSNIVFEVGGQANTLDNIHPVNEQLSGASATYTLQSAKVSETKMKVSVKPDKTVGASIQQSINITPDVKISGNCATGGSCGGGIELGSNSVFSGSIGNDGSMSFNGKLSENVSLQYDRSNKENTFAVTGTWSF